MTLTTILIIKSPRTAVRPQFDFILWTQEIDETLEMIDKAEIIEIQELSFDRTKVSVDIYMCLKFTLSKTDGKWLIEDIENRGQE